MSLSVDLDYKMSKNWSTAVGIAAGVVGVAALGGACAYLLLKDEQFHSQNQHISSRPMTIHVQIPVEQIGLVIGRGGENIKVCIHHSALLGSSTVKELKLRDIFLTAI